MPLVPLGETPAEAPAPAPLTVEDTLHLVFQWVEESMVSGPPPHQLHFGLYLQQNMAALEEKLRGTA